MLAWPVEWIKAIVKAERWLMFKISQGPWKKMQIQ
jgi:hypothetical protein